MKPLLRPALLLAGLLAAGLAWPWLSADGAAGLLRSASDPARDGWGGAAALFLGGGALLLAVGVPRQIVAYAGGFAFGLWGGTLLALTATSLACAVQFGWARLVARGWVQARMARRLGGRAARLDRFLSASPFAATLMLRLLPVGSNLALNLLAGVSQIAAGVFITASTIGYLPQTLIFALIGSGASIAGPIRIGVGVVLFAVSALAGLVLLRRMRRGGAPVDADAGASAGASDARYAAIRPAR